MNSKRSNRKPLACQLQTIRLAMKTYATIIFVILVSGALSLTPALSFPVSNVTIRNSGSIGTISPLYVEGRYIKDSFNKTVVLRGVWKAEFTDICNGWWSSDFTHWDEAAVRAQLQALKEDWGINVINTFIWADWWIDDASTSLNGYTTDTSYRWSIKETLRLAQEYGIYFQIRLYGVSPSHGRKNMPFPPYDNSVIFNGTDDFANFWADLADELKGYPNVIFTLYDEPTGNQTLWFDAATKAINAIRARGVEQIIVVHWAYCGDCLWIGKWVTEGRPMYNILFSNHIYRYHGTFENNPNSPTDIDYIRTQLSDNASNHRAYKYVMDRYNIPIWVSAIGANRGATNDDEYVYFKNTLAVLNEWELGYVAYQWFRTDTMWTIQENRGSLVNPPNRVGQALIDAIAGVPVPPTHELTINSDPPKIKFALDGIRRIPPFGPITAFEGHHTIVMPSSTTVYSHFPLFGNTEIGAGGGGYYIYLYTAGPYTINETTTVSVINFFATAAGNAKVALYNELNEELNNLIVASQEEACSANTWHSFDIPDTEILPGEYFLAIKIDTNGMLSGVSRTWFGKYRTHDYELPFPEIFGPAEGGTGSEYSIYVPVAPMQTFNYYFALWEDNSTNPERTINLTTNMTLTATYEPVT